MSVLIYTENWDGKFKKQSFELVSYGHELASMMNTSVVALSIGNVADNELNLLGNYGAEKVLNVNNEKLGHLANKAFSSIIAQAAEKEGATVILFAHSNIGKALAPRLSVKMKAGFASGVVALPTSVSPFTIKNKLFTGKAFCNIVIKSEKQILTLASNSFEIKETNGSAQIEAYSPQLNDADFKTTVTDTSKVTGKVLLNDAEIVVSGGRGMKGPEHWNTIEELASILGAATACSRPVSDDGWRPHEEHTGQTGKIIAPNLYFAFGISGAIQHVGGISSSKCIVAVNKDADAPIFEVADYGIVGDVHQVIPAIIDAVKAFKAS